MIKKILKSGGVMLAAGLFLSSSAAGVAGDHQIQEAVEEFDKLVATVVDDGIIKGEEMLALYNESEKILNMSSGGIEHMRAYSEFLQKTEPLIDVYLEQYKNTRNGTLLPEHQDIFLQEFNKLRNLSGEYELDLFYEQLESRIDQPLNVLDLITARNMIKVKGETYLEDLEEIAKIHSAIKHDLQYCSELYNIPVDPESKLITDNVLRKYAYEKLEFYYTLDVPHKESPLISFWSTLASGVGTGLIYYLANRKRSDARSEAAILGIITSGGEWFLLDFGVEAFYHVSNPIVYGILAGLRALPPAALGLYYGGGSLVRGIRNFKNERTGLRPK